MNSINIHYYIFQIIISTCLGLWSCHGDEDESTHFSRKILSNDHSVHNNYSPVIFTMKDKLRNNFKTLKMFFPMVDFLSSKSFQTVNKNLETNSLKRFPRNTNLENDLNNNTIEIISSSPITLNNNITSEITTTGSNLTFPNSTVTSIFATINTTVTSISTTINTTFPTISSLSTNSSKESNSNVTVLSGNMQTNKTFSSKSML